MQWNEPLTLTLSSSDGERTPRTEISCSEPLNQTCDDVAQASSPASSPGVPPGIRAGSGTLPQLAAGTDCATGFMGMVAEIPVRGLRNPNRKHVLAIALIRSTANGAPHVGKLQTFATPPAQEWQDNHLKKLCVLQPCIAIKLSCGRIPDFVRSRFRFH